MLHQAIGCGQDRIVLTRAPLILPGFQKGITLDGGEGVADRAFPRFVVLGEGAIHPPHAEEMCTPVRLHDKRIRLSWWRSTVGDISDPALGDGVPSDDRLLRIPRVAFQVNRGPVVHDAPVARKAPCPFREEANARRIYVVASSHHVALFSVASTPKPVATTGGAILLELAGIYQQPARGQIIAIHLLSHCVDIGRRAVVPRQTSDGLSVGPALPGVELLQFEHELVKDPEVAPGLTWRIRCFVPPLLPAGAAHKAPFPLYRSGCWEQEDLGVILRRIHTGAFPESGGLRLEEVYDYGPVQLLQRF